MTRLGQGVLLFFFSLASASTLAYNSMGHEMAGAIADELLTPTAKQQVAEITGGVPLQTAAIWPDCAKSVKGTSFTYTHDKYTPKDCIAFEGDADKARMEDYVRRNWTQCGYKPEDGSEMCHQQYHFTDVAIEHDAYGNYHGTSDHDVVASITAAYTVLAGGQAPAQFSIKDKKEALLMLAHFVGDVHQPLHVGAVYLDAQDAPADPDAPGGQDARSTGGGNLIADASTNLHADWDDVPKTFVATNPTTFANMLGTAKALAPSTGAPSTWSSQWASETLRAAQKAFNGVHFSDNTVAGGKPFVVAYDDKRAYDITKSATQRRLLAEAGARLAQMVNTALDGPPVLLARTEAIVTMPVATAAHMADAPSYIVTDRLSDVSSVTATLPVARTLVVFDIDDTLLTTPLVGASSSQHVFFGSDTWYVWQVDPRTDAKKKVPCLFDFLGINYEAATLVPTEPAAKQIVTAGAFDKLILTSRSPNYRGGTERQLRDAEIPFPASLTARASAFVTSRDGTAMTYLNGILMTRGYDKGEALFALLSELGIERKYTDVVLVDDGWKNIVQMNAAVVGRGLQFHGVLYKGVKLDPSAGILEGDMKPFDVPEDEQRQAARAWDTWMNALKIAYPERASKIQQQQCTK